MWACQFPQNIEIENKQQNKVYGWKYYQGKNENAGRERERDWLLIKILRGRRKEDKKP